MHKLIATLVLIVGFAFETLVCSQTFSKRAYPRLVVGIVVDQMRYDYIYRYWNKYSEGGFKRLVNKGFFCENTHHNFAPTYTAPGHASIYTGTTPSVHGIIANDWYDRTSGSYVYCTDDSTVLGVGGSFKRGRMSPNRMLTTTITDELRLSTNNQSKVIGIGLKDRGAILPAGHTGNAAYWYDESTGNWMTSTYYMTKLPQWVSDFNKKELVKSYLGNPWNTLLPVERYTESLPDDNAYEGTFAGEEKPVFPHDLTALKDRNGGLALIKSTPFGNSFTKDFAIQTIKSEMMGKRMATDFLTISFSSTDYIGHQFGPGSVEVEDTYLRFDLDIAEFLSFLDAWIGQENVLVFLTADHAVSDSPGYLADQNIPSGYFESGVSVDSLKRYLKNKYGDTLVLSYSNQQIFLNRLEIEQDDEINYRQAESDVAAFMLRFKGVAGTLTATTLRNSGFNNGINRLVQNGYNPKRSGDVIINLEPGWMEHGKTGTTHGSPYNYDTHVPLIWYGWDIKHGNSHEKISTTDIAPTISSLLNISLPSGCNGNSILLPRY